MQEIHITVNNRVKRIAKILWTEEEISRKVQQVARKIGEYYRPLLQENPEAMLVLVGVLNGAIPFLSDLLKELARFLSPQRIRYDTIAISSYGLKTAHGELKIEKDLKDPVAGDFVLVVEDIIDSGYTASYLEQLFQYKRAKDVKICTLILKTTGGKSNIANFWGVELTINAFVVGYGLDWAGHGRTLPYIAQLEDVE